MADIFDADSIHDPLCPSLVFLVRDSTVADAVKGCAIRHPCPDQGRDPVMRALYPLDDRHPQQMGWSQYRPSPASAGLLANLARGCVQGHPADGDPLRWTAL